MRNKGGGTRLCQPWPFGTPQWAYAGWYQPVPWSKINGFVSLNEPQSNLGKWRFVDRPGQNEAPPLFNS